MPPSHDHPASLVRAIGDEPNEAERWHALADWLFIHGRDNEAAAVRRLWRALRDKLARGPLEAAIADVGQHAAALAAIARKVERQADETPPV